MSRRSQRFAGPPPDPAAPLVPPEPPARRPPRVRVERTPVSAHAAPAAPPSSSRRLGRDEAVDLLMRAVWQLAIEMGEAPHGWADARWAARAFDPGRLLDALGRDVEGVDFPDLSSPRLSPTGTGAHRIADDGSPGLPWSWLSWMMREERSRAPSAPAYAPLLLAQAALERRAPDLWRLYRDRVLRRRRLQALADEREASPSTLRRTLARARAALLVELARVEGQVGADDYDALRALTDARPAADEDAPPGA